MWTRRNQVFSLQKGRRMNSPRWDVKITGRCASQFDTVNGSHYCLTQRTMCPKGGRPVLADWGPLAALSFCCLRLGGDWGRFFMAAPQLPHSCGCSLGKGLRDWSWQKASWGQKSATAGLWPPHLGGWAVWVERQSHTSAREVTMEGFWEVALLHS